ncbi:hypothetical protein B0H19DRAFT_1058554 [Mycena capillaripes]|nr:hypothetical protein B0H19DRAFT_1058554 [Mycena capillaripes]
MALPVPDQTHVRNQRALQRLAHQVTITPLALVEQCLREDQDHRESFTSRSNFNAALCNTANHNIQSAHQTRQSAHIVGHMATTTITNPSHTQYGTAFDSGSLIDHPENTELPPSSRDSSVFRHSEERRQEDQPRRASNNPFRDGGDDGDGNGGDRGGGGGGRSGPPPGPPDLNGFDPDNPASFFTALN